MASGASNNRLNASPTASSKDIAWEYCTRVEAPLALSHKREAKKRKGAEAEDEEVVEKYKEELRDHAVQMFARWMYDAGIEFTAVNYKSLQKAIDAIGEYGPGMKAPTMHEGRVTCLKKEKDVTKKVVEENMEEARRNGCTLMCDGLTDRNGGVVVNFLVNTRLGSVFLESVDASSYSKTGTKMFELISKYVDDIGAENVVQVVTDNASENVYAGKMLEVIYPHLYWTPCASHCIDLMFEDIFKIPRFKKTIDRAVRVNGYIYSRTRVLSMMRKYTNNKEMVRPAKTHFATRFLTLMRFQEEQGNLTSLFNSDEWHESKFSKKEVGKKIPKLLNDFFWRNANDLLKIGGPLLTVLRMVDGEVKSAMGYIYEAMDKAKEAIATAFSNDDSMYKDIFKIIDKRWDCRLHGPLHAAGYYLNPNVYFSNPNVEDDVQITGGFEQCLQKMVPDLEMQDKIRDEIVLYRNGEGMFKFAAAVRHRPTRHHTSLPPVEWWISYGASTPNLKRFAIRVLGLVCSSSGCERNWDFFEHIHSKRRNKLAQRRLNDLVYIKYNRALKRRYHSRRKVDPIILSDIDDANEWLTGEPEHITSSLDTSDETDDMLDDYMMGIDVGADEPNEVDYNLRSRLPNPLVVRPRNRIAVDEESEEDEEITPMWDIYKQDDGGDNPEEDNLVDEED